MSGRRLLLLLLGVFVFVQCQDDEGEGAPQEDDEPVNQDEDPMDEAPAESLLSSEQMHTMHAKIDANKDGKISMDEVLTFAHNMRRSMAGKDVQTSMRELDKDGDGKVSLDEMLKDMAQDGEELDAEMKDTEGARFAAADSDGNGLLNPDELAGLFYPELREGVLELTTKATLKDRDSDGNGELSMTEFWQTNVGTIEGGETTEPSLEEVAEFKKLDKDHSGTISLAELMPWESGSFHTEQSMKMLFDLADRDQDKLVSADEFTQASDLIERSDVHHHLMEWAEAENNHEL